MSIKRIDNIVKTYAEDTSGFIQSYEYGFREDYNSSRDRNEFPKLIFRVMDSALIDSSTWKSTDGAWHRCTCTAYLMQLYSQQDLDTISQIHTDIDVEMNLLFDDVNSNVYRIVKGKTTYYDRFENASLAGASYEFTMDVWLC